MTHDAASPSLPRSKDHTQSTALKAFVIAQTLLIVLAILAWGWMAARRTGALAAEQQLEHGRRLAARIEQLRQDESRSPESLPDARLTELIEIKAGGAGIRPQSIRLISPQSPVRIAQSRYGRKNTLVLLKDITVAQAAGLLHALRYPHPVKGADSDQASPLLNTLTLRLTNPSESGRPETWNVEAIVSQQVLLPPVDAGPERQEESF